MDEFIATFTAEVEKPETLDTYDSPGVRESN
jgi:hypothetical protein